MTPTPKEKALELLQKFGWLGRKWVQTNYTTLHFENAKQCSLVCVNEIIKTNADTSKYGTEFTKYYQQVKIEIENFTL